MDAWISLVTAVAGGLATGLAVGWAIARWAVTRIMAAVDRVPEKEWFERVEEKLNHLDPARVDDQARRLGSVETRVAAHCERLDHLDARGTDHEQRLRVVEARR